MAHLHNLTLFNMLKAGYNKKNTIYLQSKIRLYSKTTINYEEI